MTLDRVTALADKGRELGGTAWYPEARRFVRAFSHECSALPEDTADVLALVSPRVTVAQSVKLARAYLLDRTLPPLPAAAKALEWWEMTGAIRGRKVGAFAKALKGDDSAVVLDVHMWRALRLRDNARGWRLGERWVKVVADRLGMAPADAQACIWVAERARRGMAPAPLAVT